MFNDDYNIFHENYNELEDFDDFVTEEGLSKYYKVTFYKSNDIMQIYELALLHDITCILRETYFTNCIINTQEQVRLLNNFTFIKQKQRDRILTIVNSGETEYSIKSSMLNYCSNLTDDTDDKVMEFMLLDKNNEALNSISQLEKSLNEVIEFVVYPKKIKLKIEFNYELYKKDLEE